MRTSVRAVSFRSCFRRDLARDQRCCTTLPTSSAAVLRPVASWPAPSQLQLALSYGQERISSCMGAPARGLLCAPCQQVDLAEVDSSFRPSSAFLRPQIAIVTCRASWPFDPGRAAPQRARSSGCGLTAADTRAAPPETRCARSSHFA